MSKAVDAGPEGVDVVADLFVESDFHQTLVGRIQIFLLGNDAVMVAVQSHGGGSTAVGSAGEIWIFAQVAADHLLVIVEAVIEGDRLRQHGGSAPGAQFKNVDFAFAEHVVDVDGAGVEPGGFGAEIKLFQAVVDDGLREAAGSVVAQRYAGVAVEDVIAMGQDELNLAFVNESLGAEFFAFQEFLYQEIRASGGLHDVLVSVFRFGDVVNFNDAFAAAAVHGLEHHGKADLGDSCFSFLNGGDLLVLGSPYSAFGETFLHLGLVGDHFS